MPVLDTEVLFGLRKADRLHSAAHRRLTALSEENARLIAPDTAILELQTVIRSLGKTASEVQRLLRALAQKFKEYRIDEATTLDVRALIVQSRLEEQHGLTYFDSLIAASTLSLDSIIISNDEAFDRVPGLKRVSLGR